MFGGSHRGCKARLGAARLAVNAGRRARRTWNGALAGPYARRNAKVGLTTHGSSASRVTTKDQSTRSILDRITRTSVSFNGLLTPAPTLIAALSRYVDNLFVWNDDQTYKVSGNVKVEPDTPKGAAL
jgi:hypothetical protein